MKATLSLAAALFVITGTACRTAGTGASLKDEAAPKDVAPADAAAQPAIAPPFAKGETNGLGWEVRFNFPPCEHEGKKKGVYCTIEDQQAAAKQSGVEDQLAAWANDPTIKSMTLAFFSFSDKPVINLLCEAANARNLKVTVYLHRENIPTPTAQTLATCSPNVQVVPRGTQFGTGYLQHAKIVLASELEDPLPLHLLPGEQRAAAAETTTRWTSGSANMSSFGTSLHLDNWIFFTAKSSDRLAQENLCFFYAIKTMELGDGNAERVDFAKRNDACIRGIEARMRDDVVFYPVPHAHMTRAIYPEVKAAIDGAQTEIKVAIHRLTTASMYKPLAQAKQRGVDVQVINDDDTLRTGKCDGGPLIDQNGQDVQANRTLRAAGTPVTYLETNGEIGQLAHNKFIVIDRKLLLQGAGNFTATSLNVTNLGNMEDFYLIRVPEIVQAYSDAWDRLHSLSTAEADHEVGAHKDMALVPGNFGMQVDPSSCN
jgi:hypothetical protein